MHISPLKLQSLFRSWLCLLLFAGGLPSVSKAAEQREVYLQLSETKLVNEHLELTFLPDSMGRISQIRHLGKDLELLQPYRQKQLKGNPLFEPGSGNSAGIREMFWGAKMSALHNPMRQLHKDQEQICFASRHYGNSNFALQRLVRLLPDSAIIDFSVQIENSGGKRDAVYSIWLNILPRLPLKAMLPVKGGLQSMRGRGKQKFAEHDLVFSGAAGEQRLPPAAAWLAAYLEEADLLMLLSLEPEELLPDGFLYSWGGRLKEGPINTFEAVFGSRRLQPGEEQKHHYRIMFFPEMNAVNAVLDSTAVKAEFIGKELHLEFAAAESVQPRRLSFILEGKNEPVSLGTVALPRLRPGEKAKMQLPLPATLAGGRYELFLNTENRTVKLIGAILEI